jgi:phytoene synthase
LLAKPAQAPLIATLVTNSNPAILPPEAALALAWSGPKVRGALSIALQLDRRFAQIAARTQEPVIGQMRLAWWREALGQPPALRPRGDALLDTVGLHWNQRESALISLVNAWEVMIVAERLDAAQIAAFGEQRGAFFALLDPDLRVALHDRAASAGWRWALADAAAGVSQNAERAALVVAGLSREASPARLPRHLRGLAVLDALALRALRRGGRPLMEGRRAALFALSGAFLG